MDFATFVLLNALLYIRPMDFVPGLKGLPLFDVGFCISFLFSLPALLDSGKHGSIARHPVSICVFSIAALALVSNLLQGQLEEALDTADDFGKILLYYMLLVVVIRTPARMKWFLASLVFDGAVVAGLGVADYQGYIQVPGLVVMMENQYVNGEVGQFRRLVATGLFGDPNDLSLMIAGCVIYSAYLIGDRSVALPLRAIWLIPLPLLFEALRLTYSRGGALAMILGAGVYAAVRFGWRRASMLSLLGLPLLLRGGGRQLNFDVSGGTGQTRVMVWDAYLHMFLENPLFGVGPGRWSYYNPHVAHNSYIQVFAECGFFGGMAFLGAVLLAVWTVFRATPAPGQEPDQELVRLRTFLLASVVSYAVGIMSLSRHDVIPTYTILGMAAAYGRMARDQTASGPMHLGPKAIGLLMAASIMFVVAIFFFVRFNARYY